MKDTSKKEEVKGGDSDVPPPPPVDTATGTTFPRDKKDERKRFTKAASFHSFFDRERFKIKDKKVLPFYWYDDVLG